MTSIYNGQIYSNILVVGRTGCGKTTFFEKWDLNNFSGDIIKTDSFGENKKLDRLIIIDDVSDVADI